VTVYFRAYLSNLKEVLIKEIDHFKDLIFCFAILLSKELVKKSESAFKEQQAYDWSVDEYASLLSDTKDKLSKAADSVNQKDEMKTGLVELTV